MPPLLYGTAWKEERTAALVRLALDAGFVAIDTANQRKHYVEAAVGEAIIGVPRERLFLQTKFTYARGQDHRLPYDPRASLIVQVQQSFASSLEHLGTDRIDSYVLHGPWSGHGWADADREVWRTMEALHRAGKVGTIGISNIALDQLVLACEASEIPPAVVQNRCYARHGWDREVRALCRDRGIIYQGFSLLTANRTELADASIVAIAKRRGITVPQLAFAFARGVGMVVLTGTSSRTHMDEDLASQSITLDADELAMLEWVAD
jgi:diketogulonate reductase-like aldo/keto reductase